MNDKQIVKDSIVQHAKVLILLCEYKSRLQHMNDTFMDGCCNRILGSPPSNLHTMVVLPWCFYPTSLER